MIDQRKRIFAVNLWLTDLALTTVSFFLAYRFRSLFELKGHTVMPVQTYFWHLAIILPTWALLLPVFSVYSEPTLPSLNQIGRLSKAIGFAWLLVAVLISFVNPDASNRIIVLSTLVIKYILLVSYRVVLMKGRIHGVLNIRNVAVVGNEKTADEFARTIERHDVWGLKLLGVFGRNEIRTLLEQGGVDELIIAIDRESLDEYTGIFLLCEALGVTARAVMNFFPHSIARMELGEFEGFPLLSFSTTPTNEGSTFARRILDILLATLTLTILVRPVMVPAALLLKLTSPPAPARSGSVRALAAPPVEHEARHDLPLANQWPQRSQLRGLDEARPHLH